MSLRLRGCRGSVPVRSTVQTVGAGSARNRGRRLSAACFLLSLHVEAIGPSGDSVVRGKRGPRPGLELIDRVGVNFLRAKNGSYYLTGCEINDTKVDI